MEIVAFLKRLQSHSITPFFTSIHAYTQICPTEDTSSGGPPAWRRLETTPKLLPDLLEQFELPLYTTYSIVYLLETLVESFWVVFPMFKVSCLLLCQEARPLLTRRRFHIHASKEHTHWRHFIVKIASFNCYIQFFIWKVSFFSTMLPKIEPFH